MCLEENIFVDVSTLFLSNSNILFSCLMSSFYGHVQFLAYCLLKLFCQFLFTHIAKELLSEYSCNLIFENFMKIC
jgi:hypothetical protein